MPAPDRQQRRCPARCAATHWRIGSVTSTRPWPSVVDGELMQCSGACARLVRRPSARARQLHAAPLPHACASPRCPARDRRTRSRSPSRCRTRLRAAYRYHAGPISDAARDDRRRGRAAQLLHLLRPGRQRTAGSDQARRRAAPFPPGPTMHLRAGDALSVMTPDGRFGVPIEPGAARTLVAFAAGSGITPMLSILKTVLRREAGRFFLFYGNRSDRQHHLPRATGGSEGPLPVAAVGVPCAVARAAGHRGAERASGCGEGAAC